MITGNRVSTKRVVANRWRLAICLALGSIAVAAGCAADDGTGAEDPATDQIGVAEQASRIQWCDTEYFDSVGHLLGTCVVPCKGREQCSGITSGPDVAAIETSCELCHVSPDVP